MFSAALGAMSPKGFGISPLGLTASVDTSYYSQATPKGPSSSPFWCGALTGEMTSISPIVNCIK